MNTIVGELGKDPKFCEYIKNIEKVAKEDIIKIANSLQINTIYFLKNKEED